MSRVFRRSMVLMRRANTGPTRRFNTSGPAAEGSGQGAVPPPPPPMGDWARRLNEYELRYKQFASRVQATGERKWMGKGPVIGFVGGVVVGSTVFCSSGARDERAVRRVESLARELQDESRDLKRRLINLQQSIDQDKSTKPSYPYPTRPQV